MYVHGMSESREVGAWAWLGLGNNWKHFSRQEPEQRRGMSLGIQDRARVDEARFIGDQGNQSMMIRERRFRRCFRRALRRLLARGLVGFSACARGQRLALEAMADDARYEELFEEPPVFEEPPELERMISNSSSGPGGTRLPRGWKESVDVDGRTVFEHAKSGRREHDRSQVYDMCGTFGCILEDKHQGLHEFANADGLDRSSRTRRAPEASCPADDEGSSRGGLAGGGRARAGRARGRGTGRGSGLRPKPSPPPPQEELFNVEQVLCAERVGSVWRYLVRWKGYDDSNDSWEPEKSLSHCPVLQAYMSRARVQAGSGEVRCVSESSARDACVQRP